MHRACHIFQATRRMKQQCRVTHATGTCVVTGDRPHVWGMKKKEPVLGGGGYEGEGLWFHHLDHKVVRPTTRVHPSGHEGDLAVPL